MELDGLQTIVEDLSQLPAAGTNIALRVTAYPIRRRKGSEYHLHDRDEQKAWLAERLEGALDLGEVLDINSESVRRTAKSNGKIRLTLAQYDAVATVSDPDRLHELLVGGVGRAKNYGAGLLTIKTLGV